MRPQGIMMHDIDLAISITFAPLHGNKNNKGDVYCNIYIDETSSASIIIISCGAFFLKNTSQHSISQINMF